MPDTPTPAQVAVKPDPDAEAKLIYGAMLRAARDVDPDGDYPEWVERGNSVMQTEARQVAARIRSALLPAPSPEEQEPVAWIESIALDALLSKGADERLACKAWSYKATLSAVPLYAHPAPVPAVPEEVATVDRFVCDYNRDFRLHPQGDWVRYSDYAFATEAQAAELARAKADASRLKAANDMLLRNMAEKDTELARLREELARVNEALEWYGDQARLARLIHSGGDAGRHALQEDGGTRARAAFARNDALRAALTQPTGEPNND